MKDFSINQNFDLCLKNLETSVSLRKRFKEIEEIVNKKLELIKARESKNFFLHNFIDFMKSIEELLPFTVDIRSNLSLAEQNFDLEAKKIQKTIHMLWKNWPDVEIEGEDLKFYVFRDTTIPDYEMTPRLLDDDWRRTKESIQRIETMDRELIRVISDLLEGDIKETIEEIPELLNRIAKLLENIDQGIIEDNLEAGNVESLYTELQTYKERREELLELIDHEPTREFLRLLGRNEAWIDIYWPNRIEELQEILSWLRENFPKVIERLQFFIGERNGEME